MRFCPFCSADNELEATHCQACARKLPPPTPRRRDNKSMRASTVAGAGAKPQASVPLEPDMPSVGTPTKRTTDEHDRAEPRDQDEPARRKSDVRGDASNLPLPSRVERDKKAPVGLERPAVRAGTVVPLAPGPRREAAARATTPEPEPKVEVGEVEAGEVEAGEVEVGPEEDSERESDVDSEWGEEPSTKRAPTGKSDDREPNTDDREPNTDDREPSTDDRVPSSDVSDDAEADESGDDEKDSEAGSAKPPTKSTTARNRDSRATTSGALIDDDSDEHWPDRKKPDAGYDPHDWNARPETDSPPPTRVAVESDHEALGHRPIQVIPIPEVPESGLWPSARYTVSFVRARWQRRKAIKKLRSHIGEDTGRLDAVLGRLGAEARSIDVRTPALASENEAIDNAEQRRHKLDHDCAELSNRKAEEDSKFADIEEERAAKVNDAESVLEKAENELGSLEAQRRALRDKRKTVDKKQKSHLKAADDREAEADKRQLGSEQEQLRASARTLRQEAADLDPERQDIERRVSALDKPISQASAKVESLKAELESLRRGLNDAREGHRLRLAEIEAEQGRKSRELSQAEAEIQRRLITLGTLVNLNRIERPEFSDAYDQIDRLRGAIGGRSNEIDRLTAERDAYDKGSIIRGSLTIAGAILVVLTIILIIVAAL